MDDRLIVDHAAGHARWTGPPIDYGADYWMGYVLRRGTPIAKALNTARVAMCQRHGVRWLLDVGIGSGEFIEAWGNWSWGWDVNPAAVNWLCRRRRLMPLDKLPAVPHWINGVTLWDVLEHLPDPRELLRKLQVGQLLFLSLPIFADLDGALTQSKHFKPGEHLHYFTEAGLVAYLESSGYRILEINDAETAAGREGIKSYAAQRIAQAET